MDTTARLHDRRARTRRLIGLGGLLAKSRLPERVAALEPDEAATLLGLLLDAAEQLEEAPDARARAANWCRRGRDALRGHDAP